MQCKFRVVDINKQGINIAPTNGSFFWPNIIMCQFKIGKTVDRKKFKTLICLTKFFLLNFYLRRGAVVASLLQDLKNVSSNPTQFTITMGIVTMGGRINL